MRAIITAGDRVYLRDFERVLDRIIARSQTGFAYRSAEPGPGVINIFCVRMNEAGLFHAQANAVVDHGRAANHTALKHDDVPVGGCLQAAILEQARGHPGFFMGQAGRRIMAAGFDDEHFMTFVGYRRCGNGAASARSDHDDIGFFRDCAMTDKDRCRQIPAGVAANRSLARS